MSLTTTLAPGSLIAGKFRVIKPLGAGGMGAVYVVEHSLTKHQRALKLLHPEFAYVREVVERFLREASAAGHIGNPHIVETFDAGTLEDGSPYLVMELLKGESLSDCIARGPIELPSLCGLMTQACEGVQAAHDAGIVHRDLKPDNLFLEQRASGPFVKILDFGISKFDPSKSGNMNMTREGATLGTPYYMSPEQMLGLRAIDHRSDVYALGVILYECLTGQKPFDAETLPLLAVRIHEGKCDPLSVLRPDVPEAFARAVHRALYNHPDDRFQSARALGEALVEALGGNVAKGPAPPAATLPMLSGTPSASYPRGATEVIHHPSLAALATSALGASMPKARESSSGRKLGFVLAGAGLLLAAGAAVTLRARSSSDEPRAGAASAELGQPIFTAPPALSATPPPALSATPPPPALPESAAAPAASNSAPAPAQAAAARVAAPASPTSKPPSRPARSVRAEAQSLSTDNPFK